MLRRGALALMLIVPAIAPVEIAQSQTGAIEVERAWARAPAGNGPASLYFTLRDTGAADRLDSVESDAAGMAMLHESRLVNGVSTMREVDGVPLSSGGTVILAPGGLHVMLMDPVRPLRAGDALRFTLKFDHAPPLTATAVVVAPGAPAPARP